MRRRAALWITAVSVVAAVVLVQPLVVMESVRADSEESDDGRAAGAELTVRLLDEVPMAFVWVPPGSFKMGSPYPEIGRGSDEGPVHEVTLTQGFYLGKYEVTQEQWEMVMGTMPWVGRGYVEEGPENPVVHVSWEDTRTFVEELNAAEAGTLCRLPTEAEWEYACRAGTTGVWSSGSDPGVLHGFAWYRKNAWDSAERHARQVGTRGPNLWGLHDMHGNVWEWVQDWYSSDYYADGPPVDPVGPGVGTTRVLRGGGIYSDAANLRSANRNSYGPDTHGYFGFRIVRIAP